MLDIEFISELVVGHVHGIQNKKAALDDWYQAYEREYPHRREAESVIHVTLAELLTLMPEIDKTRWRKKSDFYSLFLFLARNAPLMPFSREGRAQIRQKLIEFAAQVDRFLTDPDVDDIPEGVKQYARAVERAASDLANRRQRENQIAEVLKDVLAAEQAAAANG